MNQARAPSKITGDRFVELVTASIGLGHDFPFSCEAIESGWIRLRLHFSERFLRPGDAISGPTMFALADTALFGAVMSIIGEQTMAVTTDLNIHFLRRAGPKDLIAEAKILSHGKRLAVGEVHLFSDGEEDPVAVASGSYALPRSLG